MWASPPTVNHPVASRHPSMGGELEGFTIAVRVRAVPPRVQGPKALVALRGIWGVQGVSELSAACGG